MRPSPFLLLWIQLLNGNRGLPAILDVDVNLRAFFPLATRRQRNDHMALPGAVERLFRRLKGYQRVFSRFEKLDVMFLGFINFVLVVDGLRGLC